MIRSFLGIHFKVDMNTVLQPFVSLGLRTFFTAVDSMLHNQNQMNQFERNYRQTRLNFSLNCQGWFTIDSNFYYMKINLKWVNWRDLHNLRVLSANFQANLKAESIPKFVSTLFWKIKGLQRLPRDFQMTLRWLSDESQMTLGWLSDDSQMTSIWLLDDLQY